jgi:hypothetical protein
MNPHITLLTLGVDDLERAVAFYRDGLGFSTKGIIGTEFENGAVAFFNLQSGLKLALWPRKSLSADSGLPLQASSAVEFSLATTCHRSKTWTLSYVRQSKRARRSPNRRSQRSMAVTRATSKIQTVSCGKSLSIQASRR